MKSVTCILLLFLFIVTPVSAYTLYLDCPTEVNVGQTIKVMGNSSFPAGTSFDLVFYEAMYTATEIERKRITLQDNNNKSITATFPTRGLKGGQYKIEVQFDSPREDQLSSDSITTKIIMVQDRSGEITFTAPLTQTMDEALRIEGSIAKLGDAGVQIEVRGPQGPVFGPTWISTKKDIKQGAGEFTKKIPVNMAGEYDIHFTDAKGYIGVITVTVAEPTTVPTTAIQTSAVTRTTRPQMTITTTTLPPTQSPIPPIIPFIAIGCAGMLACLLFNKQE
jgi:hypothetical protein